MLQSNDRIAAGGAAVQARKGDLPDDDLLVCMHKSGDIVGLPYLYIIASRVSLQYTSISINA